MIAVDTNVVVRLLTGDDAQQARRAMDLFARDTVYLSKTVILEAEWVLRYAYGFTAEEVAAGLRNLLGLEGVAVEDLPSVAQAIRWHEQGLDFADALHLSSCGGATRFASFDRSLAKAAKRVGATEVVAP